MKIPEITAKRLMLRGLCENDRDLIYRSFTESYGEPFNTELEDVIKQTAWDEVTAPGSVYALIFLRETGEYAGNVSLSFNSGDIPELGIIILKEYQNRGYGPEAITAFCNMLFETQNIGKVEVRISMSNQHSLHIFKKLGAEFVKTSTFLGEQSINVLKERFPELVLDELMKEDVSNYILKLPLGE